MYVYLYIYIYGPALPVMVLVLYVRCMLDAIVDMSLA